MRKIILGLALFMGLVFGEALALIEDEKVKAFDDLCKNGDSEACIRLGNAYKGDDYSYTSFSYKDLGLGLDRQKAKSYYEKVCKKGNEKDKHFVKACSCVPCKA